MKSAHIAAIVLILASMSLQHHLKFEEFIGGHKGASRKYLLTGSNAEDLNHKILKLKPVIVAYNLETLAIEGLCNSCRVTGKTPYQCTKKKCDAESDKLLSLLADKILKPTLESYYWNNLGRGKVEFSVDYQCAKCKYGTKIFGNLK